MSKEIKKETDWLGREKDVIYEGGQKVGETRHETTLFGNPVDRTYDNDGNRVSETRHETTLFGTSKEVTYDTHGNKISETRYEEGIFGGKRGVIRESGRKIGELKTEKGLFGRRKQVLHESGEDVDLTRRVSREKPTQTSRSHSDYDCGGQNTSSQETSRIETKVREPDRRLHVYKHTSRGAIKRALETGFYTGVTFEPANYLLRYRCDRCGHEWDDIWNRYGPPEETIDCRNGCSNGYNNLFSLIGLYRMIKGLITGRDSFGFGRLIKKEEF